MSANDVAVPSTSRWKQISTAATIVLFLVIGITGLMLLFKTGVSVVKEAHEWMGLAFVVAGATHIIRHWNLIRHYFQRRPTWITAVIVLILTAAFVAPSLLKKGAGSGPEALFGAVLASPLAEVAPILDTTPDALAAKLKSAGLEVAGPTESLEQIARRTGQSPRRLLGIIMSDAGRSERPAPR